MEVAPAVGENVPPHVLVAPGVLATCTPVGNVSLTPTPFRVVPLFGLVMVNVSVDVPFSRMLAGANALLAEIAAGKIPAEKMAEMHRVIFNLRLDAGVTAVLACMVLILVVEAVMQWSAILSRRREAVLYESPYVATRWAWDYSGARHDAAVGDAIGDD